LTFKVPNMDYKTMPKCLPVAEIDLIMLSQSPSLVLAN
jgi:hypothetical protein